MAILQRLFIFFSLIGILPNTVFAQGEINDEESKIFFQNYRTGALTVTSNGLGADFRIGNRIDAFNKNLLELGFDFIKHNKETRSDSYYVPTSSFIYGKKNSVINFRASIGKEKEFFSRHDKGGIAIKLNYQFGANLSILKPIYYEVIVRYDERARSYILEDLKFENSTSKTTLRQNIYGKASFFKGFNELTINPGGFVKLGMCFDFSSKANSINSLEGGIIFDAFLDKLDIMATEDNKQFLFSFYLSYRIGVIVSARKRNLSEERKRELYE